MIKTRKIIEGKEKERMALSPKANQIKNEIEGLDEDKKEELFKLLGWEISRKRKLTLTL